MASEKIIAGNVNTEMVRNILIKRRTATFLNGEMSIDPHSASVI